MKHGGPLLIAIALIVAGCSATGSVDIESSGPQRPGPSDPPSGPIVASLAVSDTNFVLHDEGDDCVAAEIIHRGLQTTVERFCSGGGYVVDATSTCGWFDTPRDTPPEGCDIELPSVLYGYVADQAIGYVCIGTITDASGAAGVTAARFIDPTADGYLLVPAQLDESSAAHLFSETGLRYGDPPLDAPSDPIYRLCEEQAPWGETGVEYGVDLQVALDESLQTDDVTVLFQSDLESIGIQGDCCDGDDPTIFVRVPASSSALGVTVEVDGRPVLRRDYPWPQELLEILSSGEACNGLNVVRVTFDPEALDGSDAAVELRLVGSSCIS